MIETRTTWTDSGYDCEHCGGRILRRTDHETGQPNRMCYQCEQCSCQWTLGHHPLRVGTLASCRTAQRGREAQTGKHDVPYATWLLLGLFILLLLTVLRFGGGAVLSLLLPIILIVAGISVLAYIGRNQGWW